jgi:ParB family transcriptional regulator, chromosome partitioning protein
VSKKGFEQTIKNELENFAILNDSEELQEPIAQRTKRIKNARWISIDLIQPDPDQPRKKFDENSILQLGQSIKEHGILQPRGGDKGHPFYMILINSEKINILPHFGGAILSYYTCF